ncbi:DUF4249 domain-containing protein [Flavihumibacter profundi]|uniref:DUF4249 domain-containing protein n=1 Tax=Flavihumibacter profundi TaxID=2716883 RepID=UPI001CC6E030|nr:DUF4249 domain-containing protein [Flavihumibacter profundi]MBZ5859352.1 DUF4249 domain-containing protein [Flavihumibacter profundi]
MRNLFFCAFVLLAVEGCKEKYESPVISPETGYLVVEGAINSGPGATNITLSRTTKLDNRNIQFESGAQVMIEGEDNSLHILTGLPEGRYTISGLNLDGNIKYRLRIKTREDKEYLSDYTAVKNNPPIDSINWKRENSGAQMNGAQLYVDTHDPQDSTRYYQWEYSETWEYHSVLGSTLKYEITTLPSGENEYNVVFRFPYNTGLYDSSLYYCWQNNPSSGILIASTAKLSKDVVHHPIVFIPPGSDKLSVLYSINVKQYSWSKEGYEFLERMKKNTEKTGSVFDAQPSELIGNIHCVSNSSELVIGYVTICPFQEKRIFISNKEVPDWNYEEPFCKQDTLDNTSAAIKASGIGLIPTSVPPCVNGPCPTGIVTFMAADPKCVDCTMNGGTTTRPSFWPR